MIERVPKGLALRLLNDSESAHRLRSDSDKDEERRKIMSERVPLDTAEIGRLLRDIQDFERKLAAEQERIAACVAKPVSSQTPVDRPAPETSMAAPGNSCLSETAWGLRNDLYKANKLLGQEIAKAHALKHERDEADQRAAASELDRIQTTARMEGKVIELGHRLDAAIKERDAAFWCMAHPYPNTGCAGCPAENDGVLCCKATSSTLQHGASSEDDEVERDLAEAESDLAEAESELDKVQLALDVEGDKINELTVKLAEAEKKLVEEVATLQGRVDELKNDLLEERRDHLADHNRVSALTLSEDRRCEDNELIHIELDKLGAPRRGENGVVYTLLGRIRAYSETTIPRIVPSKSDSNQASEARDILDSLGKALHEVIVMATRSPCKCGQRSDELIGGAGSASSPSESGASL